MILDGLWDPYNDFHMGSAARRCARRPGDLPRGARTASPPRAIGARRRRSPKVASRARSCPCRCPGAAASVAVDTDEEPARVDFARIGALRPSRAGRHDHGGECLDARRWRRRAGGRATRRLAPWAHSARARVVAACAAGRAPEEFPIAPVDAIQKVLERAGLAVRDIDLFEVNEAFAAVVLIAIEALDLDPARVNVHGGAVALGHPIGASGSTRPRDAPRRPRAARLRRGLATLCLGGGEAVAMVIERDATARSG
jgi:acetyl-CoA C-acetyltransferase